MKRIAMFKWMPASLLALSFLLIYIAGCREEPIIVETSSQVNITGYLENNPDKFSEWKKILDITGNSGFLQAYGNYTMFLPTNDGVKKYLQDIGKASVEQVDLQELKNAVRFHLLEDTIASRLFGDGKLNALTMLGQYLITGSATNAGITKVVINRQANLEDANIRVGNGYLHVIDNVLRPAKLTLAQMIEANTDYSVLTQALKETGLYDSLNILPANNPKTDQKFLTVLAESNVVLTAAGYPTYAALKTKYNKGNPDLKNASNGLHAYIAYHILPGAKYLADIASAQGHPTISFPELITAKTNNETIILNDTEFPSSSGLGSNYEPGFTLNRSKSDNSASNGVLHATAAYTYTNYTYKNASGTTVTVSGSTTGQFEIKDRIPFPVYWDIADMPETRASGIFRTGGTQTGGYTKSSASAPSPVKGWNWPKTGNGFTYSNALGGNSAGAEWVNRDYLNLFLGNLATNARQEWIDTRTPIIVRGKYHVWVCYRRKNQSGNWPARVGTTARIRIDGGDPSSKVFHFTEPIPFGNTQELESLGWKYYTSNGNAASPFTKQTFNSGNGSWNSPWVAKDVGIMDIKTTDFHTLRLDAVFDSQDANNIDMIHFIPVGWQSQILPRFKPDGTQDFTDYPGTHP